MASNSPLSELELLFYISSFFNFARTERDDRQGTLKSMQLNRIEEKLDRLILLLEENRNGQ